MRSHRSAKPEMVSMLNLLGSILCVPLSLAPATAQTQPAIHPNDTIRVTTAAGLGQGLSTTGRFVGGPTGGISLTTDDGRDTTFAAADLVRLEVWAGQSRNTGQGALVGAVVGGLGMGALTAAAYQECQPNPSLFGDFCLVESQGAAFLWGAVFGAVVGGVAGGVVGALIKTDRWQELEVTPYLSRSRWGVAMSVRVGGT